MRLQSIARLLLGLILAANGTAMLALPETWYGLVPGVTATGPLNLHFVRDIGCAYLVSGGAFFWLWKNARMWPAAIAGSAFLALHALVHAGEAMAGIHGVQDLLRDLPGVFLLPVLALWLAWPGRTNHSSKEDSNATMDSKTAAQRV